MATKKYPISVTAHKDNNGNLTSITRTVDNKKKVFKIHDVAVNDIKPASNYKKWGDDHLQANIKIQNTIMDAQSSQINSINKQISFDQKQQDEIDQKLKQMGYDKYVDAVNAQKTEIAKLEKERAKASASKRKKIDKQIAAAKKTVTDLNKQYKNVSVKAKDLINQKGTLNTKISNLNKSLSAVKSKRSAHASKKSAYQKQLKKNQAKERAAKVKKAQAAVKKKIKKRSAMFGYPHSAMFEYDSTSSKVVFFFDTQVDESRSASATQNPIDKGDPIMDHVQLSSMSVSISARLMDKTMHGLNQQYKTIYEWQKNKVLSFEGEVYWAHAVMTDLSKSYTTPATTTNITDYNGNWFTLNVTFTLSYVMMAKVTQPKKKPTKKAPNKGPKKPSKATKAVYATTKVGDTYWGFHKKYGTSISDLRKWNKYPDTKIPKNVKIRVK